MASLNLLAKLVNGIIHRHAQTHMLIKPVAGFPFWSQERNYAVRKGKRMRMRAEHKKKKNELMEMQKEEQFVPYNILLQQQKEAAKKKKGSDGKYLKDAPIDNVYFKCYYKWSMYNFDEAVMMHRETHHPTIMNDSDAVINVRFDLNMQLEKKKKFLKNFRSLIAMPHKFPLTAPRKVLAICNKPDEQLEAQSVGALLVGGVELIPKIESGDIAIEEYTYIVSTPDLLNDLVPVRGILKTMFPARSKGTLSFEVGKMIDRLINGVEYRGIVNPTEKNLGSAEIAIGRLSMPIEQLEENYITAIQELCTHRDLQLGSFITGAAALSPPSKEIFSIHYEKYMPKAEVTIEPEPEDPEQSGQDDDEEKQEAEATAK